MNGVKRVAGKITGAERKREIDELKVEDRHRERKREKMSVLLLGPAQFKSFSLNCGKAIMRQ